MSNKHKQAIPGYTGRVVVLGKSSDYMLVHFKGSDVYLWHGDSLVASFRRVKDWADTQHWWQRTTWVDTADAAEMADYHLLSAGVDSRHPGCLLRAVKETVREHRKAAANGNTR